MTERRQSKQISIGGVSVGGDAPVSVQSMTSTDTRDVKATVVQIKKLEDAGCEIVRVAVPDMAAAAAITEIKKQTPLPVVADIHFDYRLALASLENGCDALRLNPGNIGDAERVTEVVKAAKSRAIPIRVGVNAGSLPPDMDAAIPLASRLVEAAMRHVRLLENLDFELIKISLKAFDVPVMIQAYTEIAALTPYPLHLGVTEAGLPFQGAIRSAIGIGTLLYQGIGDTIRVSLTGDPVAEVEAAWEILRSLDLRQRGVTLVACPTCGRTEVDLPRLAEEVQARLAGYVKKPLKVAVMGCAVNGPGESRDADIGIACGKGKGVIFVNGEAVRTVPEAEIVDALMAEIEKL
jgi:(E)-4-hydroxy-3-methylbut-2-enyl-diphosphate synthase